MTKIIKGEGKERTHIKTRFTADSLVSKKTNKSTVTDKPTVKLIPDVNVLKIGGQSIIDRGATVLLPILDEIVANKGKEKMIVAVGGGTRARHVYEIALDLNLPVGVLAYLGGAVSEQNALMVQSVLSRHGGIRIPKEQFAELPMFLKTGSIPVMVGMPPFLYWALPPKVGRIPPHRTDAGAFLMGEVMGAKNIIFIKDEDGLYTDDPKRNKKAKFISKIGVKELIKRDLDDVVIETSVLEIMKDCQNTKQIQIINGLKKGNITRAMKGEHVGTIIYKD